MSGTRIPFLDQVLAPLPASQLAHPGLSRDEARARRLAWKHGMFRLRAATHLFEYASLVRYLNFTDFSAEALPIIDKNMMWQCHIVRLDHLDRQLLRAAPDRSALAWKRRHLTLEAHRPPAFREALEADVDRLFSKGACA